MDTGLALLNMTDEGKTILFEYVLFSKDGIEYMYICYFVDLAKQPHWFKEEYDDKMICFREFHTDIYPDAGLNNFNPDTKGLLFSAY